MANVGYSFSTGNLTVASLPVGSTLEVTGRGQLTVTEVAKNRPAPGDRIQTKYGWATVVSASSRFGEIEGFDPETQVLYIADGTTVVRRFEF